MIKEFKKILNNQRGVALMMIMTSIVILMAIYGEFTFDSKISRIKATNILDRSQAKLLAESGMQLAMARLRLYKEAFNYIEKNPNAKQMNLNQLINQLWEVPFIYPIPVGDKANRALKDTVEKFEKETLLEGEMKVSIQNISNRMNLNLLRRDLTKIKADGSDYADERTSNIDMSPGAINNDVSVDQSLFYLLKRLVDEKKEKDEAFEDRYANLNYQELITNLKYYVSDYQSMSQDPLAADAEMNFEKIPLAPKYGPLGSASELYTIPGWNDELIELIQGEFSVYPNTQIDFNKLTANMLRILLPTLTDEDVQEFFLYRDDEENPVTINTEEDFKKYFVERERLVSETVFTERMKKFKDSGISFGSNPNLFKIVSEGSYNRANFTLVAYVVLPKQSNTPATPNPSDPNTPPVAPPSNPATPPVAPAEQASQLLEPRIIEIQIN